MKSFIALFASLCVLCGQASAADWAKQAAEDAKQDRTTIIFDGVTPNKMVYDTTLRELPDGVLQILYDRERAKEREILMARFTEADVLAGKLVSPNSQTKMLVSKARGPR